MAVFCAPGFLLTVKEQKSMPKRFCDGFLLQRYNPSQCHFSQKTALHAMHSYDQMYPWQYFTRRGSPLLSKSKSACPALLLRDFAQRYNPPRPCFYRKPPPNAMFSYDQMYPWQYFTRRGFPSLSESEKSYPSASAPGLRRNATIRRGTFPQKTAPACHAQL